jgi:hypothetical protein
MVTRVAPQPTAIQRATGSATTSGTSGNYADQLTGANRDAYLLLTDLFKQYGLPTLAPKIFSYIQNGYSADTIAILLQDTPEFKQRFAGNEVRKKQGLAVLSPADYLATEAAYRQVMASAGLPKTFYDSPADFAQWIGTDVSPTEIKSRVDLASASTVTASPQLKNQLKLFYGIDDASITAYFLDQKRALPLLQKQEAAAAFGAEAASRGLVTDRQRMEDYVTSGLSQSQASQGFQQVAEELPNLQALAQRFGTSFGQVEEEQSVFGTGRGAAAVEKKKALASQERAMWNGSGAASPGGLQQYTGS